MKEQELKYLLSEIAGLGERVEALERLGVSGSSPASCSESRGAATGHDAHNTSTPRVRHSETEGRVKLQRLVYQLKIEADADLMNFDDWEIKYDKNGEGFTSMPAGVKLECAAVISALLSETQTESVAGGVQCCSVCKTPLEDDGEAISCPECFEIMDDSNAKRRERSESRNGKDHTS